VCNYKHYLTQPIITDLLTHRALGYATLGAVGLQAGLVSIGLPGWPCPFRHFLGVPCLGCGLSRAAVALFQGDWHTALTYHAFVLPVLLALALIITASLLPERQRRWLINYSAGIEQRLGIGVLGMIGMVGYWLVRMVFFHDTYYALIMG
jgi:hypothetical protein